MYMSVPENWLESLHLAPRKGKDFIVTPEQATGLAYAHVICDALKAGVSGVFCLDGIPCAALVATPDNTPAQQQRISSLYQILWNQGEFDYFILVFPTKIVVYTLSSHPDTWDKSLRSDGEESSPTWLTTLHITRDAVKAGELISGIESGRFFEEHPKCFNASARVDATLIDDLTALRSQLLKAVTGTGRHAEILPDMTERIHAILLQMLFLRYLEDRGILTQTYIHAHGSVHCDTLHTLLKETPESFCNLLKKLDVDLNGGLFEADALWETYAGLLAQFFEGKTNFKTGQCRSFSIYQFNHIPVELLSEIYDRFFHTPQDQEKRGAYYTPRRLAVLAIEQLWELLRSELDKGKLPKVLDPACGSGIFLATLFQRMANYLGSPDWENLKNLATYLHGLDIDITAIRISAFSLSLALLNSREPKELQKRLETETHILPKLLGVSLQEKDFFLYATDIQYDYIISNPPWGPLSVEKNNHGEKWLIEQNKTKDKSLKYPESPNKERSWPFIWKSCEHLGTKGKLTLLLPSTGFYLNNTSKHLKRLLHNIHIERLIDMSDLRRVTFKKAKTPPCILCAQRVDEAQPHRFEYIAPKADLNAVRGERILLAQQDYQLLSAWTFAHDAKKVGQRAMWCSPIEHKLLYYLDTLPTLNNLLLSTAAARKQFPNLPRPDWGMGLGFQANRHDEKKRHLEELQILPRVSVEQLIPWALPQNISCKPYGKAEVRRQHYPEGFSAPHIVMPCSISERLKATWAEWDFSFNNSVLAITPPDSAIGREEGKFLTAYLNSSFVSWYMATSLGVTIYRDRFTPSLILSLPFPQPEDLPDAEQSKAARLKIIAKMDALMRQAEARQATALQAPQSFPSEQDIKILDNAIFEYLGLRPEEIAAINDYITYTKKATQPSKGSVVAVWQSSESQHWEVYCSWLSKALTVPMSDKKIRACATPCAQSRDIVVVQIEQQDASHAICHALQNNQVPHLQDLTPELLQVFEHHLGGNIYLQRDVMIFENNKIYLVKPRQLRFWLTGIAYTDADRIIAHLLEVGQKAGALYE